MTNLPVMIHFIEMQLSITRSKKRVVENSPTTDLKQVQIMALEWEESMYEEILKELKSI